MPKEETAPYDDEPLVDVSRIAEDPDELERFYRMHLDTVERFVARRVRDPHDAADLTAEVFMAAIKSAGRYRAELGNPAAWLTGIAHRVIAADRRKKARHLRALTKAGGRRELKEDALIRIEDRIDAEASSRRLYEALGGLRKQDRQLLEMVAIDGLRIVDVAAVLEITPQAARVRLHRVRHRIKDLLDTETGFPRRTDRPTTIHSSRLDLARNPD